MTGFGHKRWVLVVALASALASPGIPLRAAHAANAADDAYAAAVTSYKALHAMPEEKRRFRHNWQDAIDRFKSVAEKYPKSSVADDALFTEGKIYYELYDVSRLKSDLESAIDAWKACATKYPASNYADDSLFWEAKADHLIGRHDLEVASYQMIFEKYPKGDMVRDAKKAFAKASADGEVMASAAPTPTAVVEATVEPKATPEPKATTEPKTAAVAVVSPAVTTGGDAGDMQTVHKVKVISNLGSDTRIVIYAGGPVHWKASQLKADGAKPPRIVVDLTKAKVGEDIKKDNAKLENNTWEIPIDDGLLQRARVGQNDLDTVRVVLDVSSMTRWNVIPFDDPFRLVIDIYGSGDAGAGVAVNPTPAVAVASTPAPIATASPIPTESPEVVMARLKDSSKKTGMSLSEQLGLKVAKIYVDAGHGGNDNGATGPTGVHEKDINLQIAVRLQKKLVELGYNAVLTRTDNTFVALEERTGIANEGKGDLFISIHCNSVDVKGNKNASGIEVYYADVASDKASARLAGIENQTTDQHMSELEKILQGLARNEFTVYSAELAKSVEKDVFDAVKLVNPELKRHGEGVKSALFYVCLTAHMPAILVETSFISNAKDEKRLADAKYQQTIADAIGNSVDAYFESRSGRKKVAASTSGGNGTNTPAPKNLKKRAP